MYVHIVTTYGPSSPLAARKLSSLSARRKEAEASFPLKLTGPYHLGGI